jgi:hypothetical protein
VTLRLSEFTSSWRFINAKTIFLLYQNTHSSAKLKRMHA